MLFSRLRKSAFGAVLLAASVAAASDVLEDRLSFGHKGSLSPDLRNVPNWQYEGQPTVLSDRIILTPPWPGTRRASIWTAEKEQSPEWAIDFEFRATGPERGGGNLQVWHTTEKHSTASIYTISKFDGLAIVVDPYGGKGGSIRGFLNDGTVDYKSHHNVDSLAFGHCNYSYRNLGRLTKLRVRQTGQQFEVTVDDRPCFKSEKVKIPTGHHFGISAASAEAPDSFEAYKFIVRSSGSPSPPPATEQKAQAEKNDDHHSKKAAADLQQGGGRTQSFSDEQYNDLKARAAATDRLLHQLDATMAEILSKMAQTQSGINRVTAETKRIEGMNGQIEGLGSRLGAIEGIVRATREEVGGRAFHQRLEKLHEAVQETHSSLMTHLPRSMLHVVESAAPRMGVFVWMVIAFQLLLTAIYVVYKRRRANAPKKYL